MDDLNMAEGNWNYSHVQFRYSPPVALTSNRDQVPACRCISAGTSERFVAQPRPSEETVKPAGALLSKTKTAENAVSPGNALLTLTSFVRYMLGPWGGWALDWRRTKDGGLESWLSTKSIRAVQINAPKLSVKTLVSLMRAIDFRNFCKYIAFEVSQNLNHSWRQ